MCIFLAPFPTQIGTNDTYPFTGAVHTKDFRTPGCINYGNGSQIVTLGINLLAPQGAPDYCGVFVNNVSICLRFGFFCKGGIRIV